MNKQQQARMAYITETVGKQQANYQLATAYLQEIIARQQAVYGGRTLAIRHDCIVAGLYKLLQAGYTLNTKQVHALAQGLWPTGMPYTQETFTLLQDFTNAIDGVKQENVIVYTWQQSQAALNTGA